MTETEPTATPAKCWRCWRPWQPGEPGCIADSPISIVCADNWACLKRIWDGTYIPRTPGRRRRKASCS